MRELTPEECEFISGGLMRAMDSSIEPTPPPIVVTASPPPSGGGGGTYYPPYNPPYYPPPPTGGTGGSGGGTTTTYVSPNQSAEANQFASAHVKDTGSTALDHAVYKNEHDKIAKLYDTLQKNPSARIATSDKTSISAAQALTDLAKGTTVITDNVHYNKNGGQDPAYTIANADGTTTSYINTSNSESMKYENQNPAYSYQGTSGQDYEFFHELGHQIQYQENRDLFNANNGSTTESQANTIGRALEQNAGVPLMTGAQGQTIDPQNGYYIAP